MLEATDPWQELTEGETIGVIDRFALQHRLPKRRNLTAADREMPRGARGGLAVASRDVVIDAGAGANTMKITETAVHGDLRVGAGDGDDSLSLTNSVIAGKRKIHLGGGSNTGP